jgi:hypothetical protein
MLVILASLGIPSVYGHGLGGEILPPVTIGNRNASLAIDVSPSTYNPDHPENYVTLRLFDSNTQAIIEHVTFIMELKKDGEQIFSYMFHDELGNLWFRVTSNESDIIEIDGVQEPLLGGWMRSDEKPLTLNGPVFSSGGLYEYKIEILTVDSDDNILDQKIELEGAISIAEKSFFVVKDSQHNPHDIQIISYFDTLENVNFESNKLDFSMPFDWNQDFEQLSVVHEEIIISEEFSEFFHIKYDVKVNDIPMKGEIITIDDYSLEGRTVHIVINKEELKQIKEQAMQRSDSKIFFEIGPSKDTALPLVEPITSKFPIKLQSISKSNPNEEKYDVDLTWFPAVLIPGEESEFVFTIYEKNSNIPVSDTYYEFILIQNNEEIFRKAGTAPAGGSFEDFVFSEDNAGQILVKLDRINKSDEYVEISVNVVPEFGLFSLLVLDIAFVMVLIMGRRIMFYQNFQNNNIL